ncbi:MAG: hypothetical protein ACM31O_01560 [Bacteroidota bacterium]
MSRRRIKIFYWNRSAAIAQGIFKALYDGGGPRRAPKEEPAALPNDRSATFITAIILALFIGWCLFNRAP